MWTTSSGVGFALSLISCFITCGTPSLKLGFFFLSPSREKAILAQYSSVTCYLLVNHTQVPFQSHVYIDQSTVGMYMSTRIVLKKAAVLNCFGGLWNMEAKMEGKGRYVLAKPSIR